jgi:hypothetical protein
MLASRTERDGNNVLSVVFMYTWLELSVAAGSVMLASCPGINPYR